MDAGRKAGSPTRQSTRWVEAGWGTGTGSENKQPVQQNAAPAAPPKNGSRRDATNEDPQELRTYVYAKTAENRTSGIGVCPRDIKK
jgi:type II secretory pathway component PulC